MNIFKQKKSHYLRKGILKLDWTGMKIGTDDYNVLAISNKLITCYELSKSKSRYDVLRNLIGNEKTY
ncbi:MAG: hypothetical protein HQK49_13825 [Oligoflexia bacterium]|nr:hypothetical protein [Oligoflexia bacterium]